MPVIEMTFDQKKEKAKKEDKLKLSLEKKFSAVLWPFLKDISRAFSAVYSDTGAIINANDFMLDLAAIIEKVYINTGRTFSESFESDIDKQLAESTKEDEESERTKFLIWWKESRKEAESIINEGVAMYAVVRALQQSTLILNTTDDVIRRSVRRIRDDAITDGIELTNKQISKRARKEIDKINRLRVPVISETEVQNASMTAKQIEAEETNIASAQRQGLDEDIPESVTQEQIKKTWVTMRDDLVRSKHKRAEGQRQLLKDPYLVGGELLMYPGDTSLGATAGNVINCRCNSIIT